MWVWTWLVVATVFNEIVLPIGCIYNWFIQCKHHLVYPRSIIIDWFKSFPALRLHFFERFHHQVYHEQPLLICINEDFKYQELRLDILLAFDNEVFVITDVATNLCVSDCFLILDVSVWVLLRFNMSRVSPSLIYSHDQSTTGRKP